MTTRSERDITVLLKKKKLVEDTTFISPEGRMVILDVTFSSSKSFRLVGVYKPFGNRQSDFF